MKQFYAIHIEKPQCYFKLLMLLTTMWISHIFVNQINKILFAVAKSQTINQHPYYKNGVTA